MTTEPEYLGPMPSEVPTSPSTEPEDLGRRPFLKREYLGPMPPPAPIPLAKPPVPPDRLAEAARKGKKRLFKGIAKDIRKLEKAARRPPKASKEMSQVERYWVEEAQDFEPFGGLEGSTFEDAHGVDILKDPFEGAPASIFTPGEALNGRSFLGSLFGGEETESQYTIVQELNINVPGGLLITHEIEDPSGRRGYLINWGGERISWFPG